MEDNQNHISKEPSIAAFFDVDNTIIRGASAFHLAKALYRRGFFRKRDIFQFFLGQLRYRIFGESNDQINELKNRALYLMKGHPVAEVLAVGEDVYDQVLQHRIYPGTKKILDKHLSLGHEVWLITATPVEIGELIARRLGATGALASQAEHEEGVYTGFMNGNMMHGLEKSKAVKSLASERDINLKLSYAYGDSMNDRTLLESVGNPCAINPDGRLRKLAKQKSWPVVDFSKRRKIARGSIKSASVAGGIWVTLKSFQAMRKKRKK